MEPKIERIGAMSRYSYQVFLGDTQLGIIHKKYIRQPSKAGPFMGMTSRLIWFIEGQEDEHFDTLKQAVNHLSGESVAM
jgi:hypothetical protein